MIEQLRRATAIALTACAALFLVQAALADYKQAVAYYKQGRFEKAIQELKTDLEQNPDWEFGHRLMGLSYLNLRNNALAISALTRAVDLKSSEFATYQGLAQAYFNIQRFDSCIQSLNRGEAFAQPGDRFTFHYMRGSSYYRLERFNEAVTDLTAAIRVSSGEWAAFSQLGIAYYNLNRHDEAIQALLKALALRPGQSTTVEYLGKAHFKKGTTALAEKRYDQALEMLRKARDYTPKDWFVHYNIAEAFLFQKSYSEAEKSLNQALDINPRSAEVYQRLGLVYEKQSKWDLSLNAYSKANELNPSAGLQQAIARVTELKKR